MLKKIGIGAVVLLAFTTVSAPAVSAKSVDCTGKSGTRNCPRDLPQVETGPLTGKFILTGTAEDDRIRGSKAEVGDLIRGYRGEDVLIGERGDDVLDGGYGNDSLDGSGDDDILKGGNGNDTLSADAGSDMLLGGPGNDRYVVPKKSHVINDSSGKDTLVLDVPLEMVTFEEKGNDLIVSHRGGSITIKNHFGSGRIEIAKLADGDQLFFTNRKVTLSGPSASQVIGDDKGGENNREREQRIERDLTRDFDNAIVFDVTFFCCGTDERVEFGVTIKGRRYNIPEAVQAIVEKARDFLGLDDNRRSHQGNDDDGTNRNSLTDYDEPDDTYCGSCDGNTGSYDDVGNTGLSGGAG